MLLSIQDRKLGDSAFLMATLAASPACVYPWPRKNADQFYETKSKILLAAGFTPCPIKPVYADLADILTREDVSLHHWRFYFED